MNFFESLKKIKPFEIVLIVVFILYIIIPSETPSFVATFANSSLGILFLFIVAVSLFIYTNPILGVLYIIFVYELLRRSSGIIQQPVYTSIMQNTPSQMDKDQQMKAMNPPVHTSLEEQVIQQRAPIGKSSEIEFIDSEFKPVADKIINGTSMY